MVGPLNFLILFPVKLVVYLSTNVKSYIDSHPLTAALRANMVELTNATEAFVILLHVSSFANSPTHRPYTPLTNGLPTNSAMAGPASDDSHHLGGGLMRSRSAQPSTAKPISPLPTREMPHSASPHQTFRIPPISHQPRTTPEAGLDVVS